MNLSVCVCVGSGERIGVEEEFAVHVATQLRQLHIVTDISGVDGCQADAIARLKRKVSFFHVPCETRRTNVLKSFLQKHSKCLTRE